MLTGSIFTAPRGPGLIAVTRSLPPHLAGRIKRYPALATPRRMSGINTKAAFCRAFFAGVLRDLDPAEEWAQLHELAGPGVEPVIACFERPPWSETNFCHRRLVARWFADRLGEEVLEMEPPPARQGDLFGGAR